jgi:hypothetical protein
LIAITYSDYRIRRGKLYGEGEWKDIQVDIAKYTDDLMNVCDETSLVRFAREFGFLGYQQLRSGKRSVRRSEHASTPVAGRNERERAIAIRPYGDGEPIQWILAHARTMRAVLRTVTLLNDFKNTRSKAALLEIKKMWRAGPFAVGASIRNEGCDIDQYAFWRRGRTFISEEWGLAQIHSFVSGNICGVHPRVTFEISGEPRTEFGFRAPLERAYFQLWESIVGSKVKLCKTCFKIFRAEDPRSLHCSDQCRQRFATRSFRKRLKDKAATKPRKP